MLLFFFSFGFYFDFVAHQALHLSRSCTRHMMNAIITVTYTPPLLFFACFTFSHADWL